jgi:tetratricopeptide (TPR) repeat protein
LLETELGLALCHDEAGQHDEAGRGYERALETARRLGSPDPLCKTLRNVGLYYVEREPDRGMALLREAARTAQASAAELARSRMALGIRLQHLGELAEAREALTQGLAGIDPAEPDAICARSHLRAIEEHASCGCGEIGKEYEAQLERIIRERLPPDLAVRIEFGPDGAVSIHASRALVEAEGRLLADTVNLAMTEMRQRIKATYG